MAEQKNILVVDDEEHTRLGYAEILKMDGYAVDTAENAMIGMEKAQAGAYDIIITDLRMPEIDGLTFMDQMKKQNTTAKFIMITAFGSYKTYRDAERIGTAMFLNKPVRARELKEAVTAVLTEE